MDKMVNSKRSRGRPALESVPTKPSRAEAEAAVRTLIRWAGDDPDREGLLATPSRVVRAYEEWFAGYNDDPREYLKRTFEETGGYDEVVVLRDIRFEFVLRASYRADHRSRAYRLSAAQPRGRHFQIGAAGRSVFPAAADSGEDDRRDRLLSRCGAQTAWRRGGYGGHASVHDDARRAQDRRLNGDKPHARRIS